MNSFTTYLLTRNSGPVSSLLNSCVNSWNSHTESNVLIPTPLVLFLPNLTTLLTLTSTNRFTYLPVELEPAKLHCNCQILVSTLQLCLLHLHIAGDEWPDFWKLFGSLPVHPWPNWCLSSPFYWRLASRMYLLAWNLQIELHLCCPNSCLNSSISLAASYLAAHAWCDSQAVLVLACTIFKMLMYDFHIEVIIIWCTG